VRSRQALATRTDAARCLRREQGLSQDQLAAALPTIDVQRVAESLNALLSRVRARQRRRRCAGEMLRAC